MSQPKHFRANAASGRLTGPGFDADCVFGTGGLVDAAAKREGDKASPIGVWPVRRAFYRADRIAAPHTALTLDAIEPATAGATRPMTPPITAPSANPMQPATRPCSAKTGSTIW
jgi:L,D-peptidoglycan transpeptidase YkuD (ErfK/YbiS/YcfS/YnhG family)